MMVVLNILGKIEPICISQKLKIYISNLPNETLNNWNEYLVDEMHLSLGQTNLFFETFENNHKIDIKEIACTTFSELSDNITEDAAYKVIADNMICLYFDFVDDDWITERFDSKACEVSYSEKFIAFINFAAHNEKTLLPQRTPCCIFSTTHTFKNPNRIFAFAPIDSTQIYIQALKKWGEIIDAFLQEKSDYLLLDYLINSIHLDNNYNEYHYFKAYSLCQLFLEKNQEKELDEKLPQFLDERYSIEERNEIAPILRKMRNKIAHGDFIAFDEVLEEYTKKFMDNRFWFDYSEYSRRNWALLNSCCLLNDAIRQMLSLLFTDKNQLSKL